MSLVTENLIAPGLKLGTLNKPDSWTPDSAGWKLDNSRTDCNILARGLKGKQAQELEI